MVYFDSYHLEDFDLLKCFIISNLLMGSKTTTGGFRLMSRLVASAAAILGIVGVAGSLVAVGSSSTRLRFDEDSNFSLALNSVLNCFTSCMRSRTPGSAEIIGLFKLSKKTRI